MVVEGLDQIRIEALAAGRRRRTLFHRSDVIQLELAMNGYARTGPFGVDRWLRHCGAPSDSRTVCLQPSSSHVP